jgi:hypothetical protein
MCSYRFYKRVGAQHGTLNVVRRNGTGCSQYFTILFCEEQPMNKPGVLTKVSPENYLCAECGNHQDSMNRKCDACDSVKMVSKHFAIDLFGENYMRCFEDKPDEKD